MVEEQADCKQKDWGSKGQCQQPKDVKEKDGGVRYGRNDLIAR